ncbi:neutral and basic amino acid transport protein rBAT-like [Aphis gossypii]|uniref:alpha-glucosidase n=1 Tax=Aphis gossypii TaxID=80765 RepID=A0A9P0JH47_APHGO|nr:neutral and basic amino acid transport protein rBAT-like [Aphis gossypii]XP_050059975.1 neutral and basic amino acid transport protein rBAT-like [Aphis gossypii]CAH1738583.1 unnamed protein product [Aphis gossypii]
MSLDKDDGAVEKLMEEGKKKLSTEGDKYDELNKLELSDHTETAYAGMGKEELMKYANSPFWVRLRWLLFVTFWLSWFAMMFGALFIIFLTPKCFPPSKHEWYQKSPVYIINAASLVNQSNLNERIEYIQQLGVQNVVLTSVFDGDGDKVIDFMQVNKSLGSNDTMKDFIKNLKSKGMKVILRLVPNHSSKTNMMFVRSVLKEQFYDSFYIWNSGSSNGTQHYPINNWLSVTGESAWSWDDNRKQYYLHTFSADEPDFNFRNKDVVNYFEEVFKYWLDMGIDGLYLDKVQYLFKDKDLKNDSLSNKATSILPETNELLSHWGDLIRNYSGILIVSDLDSKDTKGINMVHNSVTLTSNFTGEQLLHVILTKKNMMSSSSWSSWEWVCTDKPNCWKNETIDAFSILGSLLPGVPFINADPKLFENNKIPNITFIQSTLKELRSMPTIEFGSFNVKLLNNDTVFAFDRVMNGSESLLFAWNLSQNVTVLNLNSFDGIPAEVNLSLCTESACSILPPPKSKVNSNQLRLAGESAVVLTF